MVHVADPCHVPVAVQPMYGVREPSFAVCHLGLCNQLVLRLLPCLWATTDHETGMRPGQT